MRPPETPPDTAMAGDTPPSTARRTLLLGGVATLAVAGGVGVGLKMQGGPAVSPHAAALSPAETLLWSQRFDTPAGEPLALALFAGKPLLVNFWATWCPPCIEELPLLDRFYRDNAANGWQVLGLAVDQPSAVKAFLQKTPLSFPSGLAGFGGTELGKALGNVSGALPFTVVLGAAGSVLQRKMGKVHPEDLAQWRQLR